MEDYLKSRDYGLGLMYKRAQVAHWVGGIYSESLDSWFNNNPVPESELVETIDNIVTTGYYIDTMNKLIAIIEVDEAMERMAK